MLGHCRGCLSRYGFQSKNSHVFLCQNVSNLVQSSLVFQTVFCLTASPPFTKRSKLREKTRASGSRDVSRLPQIETLLAGYVHTYDNFLLRVEEGGGGRKWGENEKLSFFPLPDTHFPGPCPQANLFTVANQFFFLSSQLWCLFISICLFSQRTISVWSTSPQRKIYKKRKINKKTPAHKRGRKGISAYQITVGIKD